MIFDLYFQQNSTHPMIYQQLNGRDCYYIEHCYPTSLNNIQTTKPTSTQSPKP